MRSSQAIPLRPNECNCVASTALPTHEIGEKERKEVSAAMPVIRETSRECKHSRQMRGTREIARVRGKERDEGEKRCGRPFREGRKDEVREGESPRSR